MLVLAAENPRQPLVMYIDSPGGPATESLPILSTIDGIKCPVGTFCCGEVGGTAVLIAAHGKPGARVALPSTRFSFDHLERDTRLEGLEREQFLKLLAENLSRDVQKQAAYVLDWFQRGAEFTASEALKQGLIDLISTSPAMPPQSLPGAT
jgi:ATP-dependent Clp protease, protease subunit